MSITENITDKLTGQVRLLGGLLSSTVVITACMLNQGLPVFAGSIGLIACAAGPELLAAKRLSERLESITREADSLRSAYSECQAQMIAAGELTGKLTQATSELALMRTRYESLVEACDVDRVRYSQDIGRLQQTIDRLSVENLRYTTSNELVLDNAKLRLEANHTETQTRLTRLVEQNKIMRQAIEVVEPVITELQSEFAYLTSDAIGAIELATEERLTTANNEITRLRNELAQLTKPQLFEAIGEYSRADLLINHIYDTYGLVLDASEIEPGDGTFVVYLNVRDRAIRGKALIASLNELSPGLQVRLNLVSEPVFKFDDLNHHRLSVTLRHKLAVKKPSTLTVKIPWESSDRFTHLASKWRRIRITGGSESGKTPLAELVIAAIQTSNPTMSTRVAFPIENSSKQHLGIPIGFAGVTALRDCLSWLLNQKPDRLSMAMLDEVDTGIASDKSLVAAIKQILKVGSHVNQGVVLIGQNANVKQWVGFDRSDFENCVSVHIGSNAGHAITNSNLSAQLKGKLEVDHELIRQHCDEANEGVDNPVDLTRYALVIDPKTTPYFLQIPRFGSLTYDTRLELSDTPAGRTHCPHCSHPHVKSNGGNRRKCLSSNCGKSFTV